MEVYNSSYSEELLEELREGNKTMFDGWALRYEKQVLSEYSYDAPNFTVEYFCKYVKNLNVKIFDAGCGTGIVGKLLSQKGYTHLVAGDISVKMLEEAKKKNVYSEFYEIFLGKKLEFEDKAFDCVICVGVFGPSGPPPDTLLEFVRITKEGGFVIFSEVCDVPYRSWKTGYQEEVVFYFVMNQLKDNGKWKLIEVSDKKIYYPGLEEEQDFLYRIWVYQVL